MIQKLHSILKTKGFGFDYFFTISTSDSFIDIYSNAYFVTLPGLPSRKPFL